MYIILCPTCGSQEIEPVQSKEVVNTFVCAECEDRFNKADAEFEKGEKFIVQYEGEMI
jgi:transcription elongation factor Elf1